MSQLSMFWVDLCIGQQTGNRIRQILTAILGQIGAVRVGLEPRQVFKVIMLRRVTRDVYFGERSRGERAGGWRTRPRELSHGGGATQVNATHGVQQYMLFQGMVYAENSQLCGFRRRCGRRLLRSSISWRMTVMREIGSSNLLIIILPIVFIRIHYYIL